MDDIVVKGLRARHRDLVWIVLLSTVAFMLRLDSATRQGLGVDEIFSLAMATGHSVEHPAAKAVPELGDFIQASAPQTAAEYRRFVRHPVPPASLTRTVRAVFLSDTNPPLYYMVLNLWTRLSGTSDLSLRLLSVILSVLSVPLCFALGRRLFSRRTGVIAAILFALAPQAVFRGSEGRMYAMSVFLILLTALLTLRLRRRPDTLAGTMWIACSAAGLLTHYFFVFPWVAMAGWLLVFPHRLPRHHAMIMLAIVLIAIAPWFVLLPDSMDNWRVTKGWLEGKPRGFTDVKAQARLFSGYFMVGGDWLTREGRLDYLLMGTLVTVSLVVLAARPRFLLLKSTIFLLAWILASNLGLLVFDLWQGTYARHHSRYVFAGIPAGLTLFAAIAARAPLRLRLLAMATIVVVWAGGLRRLNAEPRKDNPFKAMAGIVNDEGIEDRVVIVHAIPTSVLGHARYFDPGMMMMDWVAELGTRTDIDAWRAQTGASRVTVIVAHSPQISQEERYFAARADSVHRSEGPGYRKIDFFLGTRAMEGRTYGDSAIVRPPGR